MMGIDGCRSGWVAVEIVYTRRSHRSLKISTYRSFKDVLSIKPSPDVIAIDIPIGLLNKREVGGRVCDREARRILGRLRLSSVFSAPIRPALRATIYEEAKVHGLTLQGFGILPKVREVNGQMTSNLQSRVFEVHPEVSFWAMNGSAMRHNKKGKEGREERLQVLRKKFPGIDTRLKDKRPKGVGLDDLLDAFAAAWTAMRIASGQSVSIPPNPSLDRKGLRMGIWY